MVIGERGLANVDLVIPQGCSFAFEIVHTDDDGHPVDHTGSTLYMAFQDWNGRDTAMLSECCTGTETGVDVSIPADTTAAMETGRYFWDVIADMGTETVRLAYGTAEVTDTYALDGGGNEG